MRDIGIGEPEIIRRKVAFCTRRALGHGPDFSRPSRRSCGSGYNNQPPAVVERPGNPASPVRTLIVNENDAKRTMVILRQQTANALGNDIGLVARGNNSN